MTSSEQQRTRRQNKTEMLNKIKLAAGCIDCGYSEYACVLDFDHKPGQEKLFGLGGSSPEHSVARILAEVAKCDVRCSNCHRVRHHMARSV